MRVRIKPKKVISVSTILVLSTSLANALSAGGHQAGILDHGFVNQETARNVDDQPLSPRLVGLRDRIKSGDREALDNFWKEISERGAPIVEEVPGNNRDVLVTMLWRATAGTKNVFVFRIGEVNKPMVRLLDTDLC